MRSIGISIEAVEDWGTTVTVCWDVLVKDKENAFGIAAVQLNIVKGGKPFTEYYRGKPFSIEDQREGRRNGVRFA
ncbi:MAG: hypothetical protein AB2784_21860 [Candidatus Thiodiazotropha endolucinida]